MSFVTSTKFSGNEKNKIHNIIKKGLSENQKPKDIIFTLKKKNLSYRKQNMLLDIRRHNSAIYVKTPTARDNAQSWFDNVFEPMRKQKKWNSKQATEFWNNARTQSYEGLTDMEISDTVAFWEMYKREFG